MQRPPGSRRPIATRAAIALLLLAGCATAPPTEWTVVRVRDGDSVIIECAGLRVPARFADLDAPELGEPGGPEAKRLVEEIFLGKPIRFRQVAIDRYNRPLIHVLDPPLPGQRPRRLKD